MVEILRSFLLGTSHGTSQEVPIGAANMACSISLSIEVPSLWFPSQLLGCVFRALQADPAGVFALRHITGEPD